MDGGLLVSIHRIHPSAHTTNHLTNITHPNTVNLGILRHSQVSAEIYSLHLDLGLPWGLLPAGCAWNNSLGR